MCVYLGAGEDARPGCTDAHCQRCMHCVGMDLFPWYSCSALVLAGCENGDSSHHI